MSHLTKSGQTYLEHLCDAWSYSIKAYIASCVFFIHGLIPDTFIHTGSAIINSITSDISEKMQRLKRPESMLDDE
jgi:hypothetical protein